MDSYTGFMNQPPHGQGRGNTPKARGKNKAKAKVVIPLNDYQFSYLDHVADLLSTPPKGNNSSQQKQQKPTMKEVLEQETPWIPNQRYIQTELVLDSQDEQWMPDPWEVKSRYFQTQQYAAPDGRHRYIYEAILTETSSVEINHTKQFSNSKDSPLTYSKAIFKRLIRPSDWGLNPNLPRKISYGHSYNYWDYISAWTYSFFYENPKHKHSWFLKICPQSVKADFPNWVISWWAIFGPDLDILPESIQQLYLPWQQFHPQLRGNDNIPIGKSTILFFTEFGIPWIWKWDFQCGYTTDKLPVLQRIFYYRWWSGMTQDPIQALLHLIRKKTMEYMDNVPKLTIPEPEIFNPFELVKDMIRKQQPLITEANLMVKCMDFMKNKLVQTFDSSTPTV
ncbi:uncharacterized protein LOC132285374 [Cornus florida]|uniref:uncharacterized protein LOC132285374 n=1 Tax=Cornus florida TaxID=4283 RepID=UPI00289B8630|nr:uncharacterized protein LOC132285374 [Cornus florida]